MNNEQFAQEIDELYAKAKRGELEDRQARFDAVEALTERYFEENGEMPDYLLLDRLATLCLREEMTDMDLHKVSRNEYPIMSERQQERRQDRDLNVGDVFVGQAKLIGFRKTWSVNEDGSIRARRQRIYAK